ncbi:SurA N-terminal domain-containing protein [Pseudoalteromonas sp. G4]|uniref:SurA N-terminal domain-containing protein n=1 Tax=Pseudoalteromonas sp. G4 TaxID=2992761 RepID=UPI00237D60DA|nr:SurA N-terminal domain-containing protein [Pseudoalteromonas sp. G4]MDE3274061.1 SurA N-terminal domain-containing protein [Pseudoalteromonas sp. G4]
MLERIREGSQGATAKVILTLVILSFALAGIGSYLGQPTETPVATVNGKEISQMSFARAYENERSRLEQQFGEYFSQIASDPAYTARMRENVIQRLVQQELQMQLAQELGLRVSDEAIKEEIRNIPAFQVAGEFNNDRYLQVIRQMNYQPDGFRDYLRKEMTLNQLASALIATDFTLENELAATVKLQNQLRDIESVTLSAANFKSEVTVSEDEIKEYYQLNQNQFMAPEMVALDYIELKGTELPLEEAVTDAEIAANYEENKALYMEPERRRVAHILVENLEDDAAAQAKAEEILAELQNGADFAAVAKEKSDDLVSAEIGGDLEWIDRDMMDPEFEAAAFALENVGDLSEVVKSEFGYHIIKLTDYEPEQVKQLADVSAEIKAQLELDKRLNHFYEVQTRVADLAFEVADSLTDAAEAAGVEVKSTELFSRNNAPAPLNNPKVLNTAFSVEILEDGVNSELIEVADEHIVFIRAKEHKAAAVKPLEEVSAGIQLTLENQKASELAKEKAQELYASLQAGTALSDIAAKANAEVVATAGVKRQSFAPSYEVVQAVFKMPTPSAEVQSSELVTLGNGDVSLVVLNKVYDAPAAEISEQMRDGIARQQVNKHYEGFIKALQDNADVKTASVAAQEPNL